MPTDKLALTTQADGATNWDDGLEANWATIDEQLTLSRSGNPNGNVAGRFIGQFCYDSGNGLTYVCTKAGSASTATWVIDDGTPVGTVRFSIATTVPPGWLKLDGSDVAQSAYPRLAAVMHSSMKSGTKITLPDMTIPTVLKQLETGENPGNVLPFVPAPSWRTTLITVGTGGANGVQARCLVGNWLVKAF